MHREEGETTVTPVEARQGYRDKPVLLVLVVSLVLIVVVFGLLWGSSIFG
jgi:hypothetical protein